MSSPLHRLVYPLMDKTGVFRYWSGRSEALRVVTYHGVISKENCSEFPDLDGNFVTSEQLRKQLVALRRDFEMVTPAEILAWARGSAALPKRALLITCDDGLANNVSEMLPVLLETHAQAIFFCTAEFSTDQPKYLWHEELYAVLAKAGRQQTPGTANDLQVRWWRMVNDLGKLPGEQRRKEIERLASEMQIDIANLFDNEWRKRRRLMTKEEIRRLQASGMTIGSHTVSHALLARMSDEDAATELKTAKRLLEEASGRPVWAVSYPFGGANDAARREWELAKKAGYAFGVMNIQMQGAGPLNWGRVNCGAGTSTASLNAHLSGFHDSLKHLLRRGR